jgi:hypothetical protein
MAFNYKTWADSWASTWADSWGVVGAVVDEVASKGGIPPKSKKRKDQYTDEQFKQYRDYLKTLERASREDKKYIIEVAKEIKELDLDIELEEITKIAEPPPKKGKLSLKFIDYDALQQDLIALQNYFETLAWYKHKLIEEQKLAKEAAKQAAILQDEEEAFLLLIV